MIAELKSNFQRGKYFDIRRVVSAFKKYNTFFVYGPRGDGKTYSCLRLAVNEGKRTGRKFIGLWQTQEEVKEKKKALFEDFPNIQVIGMDVVWTEGEDIVLKTGATKRKIISQKRMGRIDALNNSSKIRGGTYSNFGFIFWDEFMDENKRYISNVSERWFSICETIGRTQPDIKFIAVANEVDPDCPVFRAMNINDATAIPPNNFQMISHRKIVCVRLKTSEKLKQAKAESAVGYLTKGTKYGEYAYDNAGKNEKSESIGIPEGVQKPNYNVALFGQIYGIYKVTSGMFISTRPHGGLTYPLTLMDARNRNLEFRGKDGFINHLNGSAVAGRAMYESFEVKEQFDLGLGGNR